jgi:prevent-host-death family protein
VNPHSVYFEVYTVEALMKTATAKDLRSRAAAILEQVRKGDEVVITLRGESVAVIKPMQKVEKPFNPVGFGIWRGRKDIKNVKQWLDERRKERFPE